MLIGHFHVNSEGKLNLCHKEISQCLLVCEVYWTDHK